MDQARIHSGGISAGLPSAEPSGATFDKPQEYPEDLIRRFNRVAEILATGAIRAAVARKQQAEAQSGQETTPVSEPDLRKAA